MLKLKTEYIDVKNTRHNVEHVIVPADDNNRERVISDLFRSLTRLGRRIPNTSAQPCQRPEQI